ncbi:MAG: VWA domain-containing protein [Chloroflexi bacterium]|nr:VWA domain-containing protein [Chloroflexota bacterium]
MGASARLARLALLLILVATLTGLAYAEGQPSRVSVTGVDPSAFPEMSATVVVLTGAGIPVTGLTRANFEIIEDSKSVPVASVDPTTTNPASITVVLGLDASGSMEGKPLADAVAALTAFVDRLAPNDQVATVRFGGGGCVVQPGPGPTADRLSVVDFLRGSRAVGDTPLYDATLLAIQTSLRAPGGRRMVVILTDGDDTCSKVSADTVVAAAVRNGIPLYFIGLGPDLKPAVLENLARLTGGAYLPAADSSRLAAIYEGLGALVRTQYLVRYRSAQLADRKEHALSVRVKAELGEATGDARFTPPVILPSLKLSVSPNQRIEGPTRVEVTTSAPVQLTRADFVLDGRLLQSVSQPPLVHTLDLPGLAGGIRTLRVRAVDAGGGEGEAAVPLDFARPVPRLSVLPNQRITVPTRVEVTTVPAVPLARADFYLDNSALASVTQPPLAYTIDPTGLARGPHAIRVRIADAAGAEAEAQVPVEFGETGLFGAIPFWLLVGIALLLPIAVVAAAFRRAPSRVRPCPACGRILQPDWAVCPYCDAAPREPGRLAG